MSKRTRNNCIATLIVFLALSLLLVSGCATVTYERDGEHVTVKYSKFATKMSDPEFWFKIEGEEKSGGFSAAEIDESASANTLATSVGKVLEQGGSITAVIPGGGGG